MKDPFFKYTLEEKKQMSDDAFFALLEESNEYVDEKYRVLNEEQESVPKFNTIEELRAYYNCRPLDEVITNFNKIRF